MRRWRILRAAIQTRGCRLECRYFGGRHAAIFIERERKYRPKWWIRIFSIFFFGFSAAGLIHFTRAILSGEEAPNWVSIVGPAFLSLVGLCMVAYYFNTFVIISFDALEFQTLLATKRLSVSEVRGRYEYETTDSDGVTTRYVKLFPVDREKKRQRVAKEV